MIKKIIKVLFNAKKNHNVCRLQLKVGQVHNTTALGIIKKKSISVSIIIPIVGFIFF